MVWLRRAFEEDDKESISRLLYPKSKKIRKWEENVAVWVSGGGVLESRKHRCIAVEQPIDVHSRGSAMFLWSRGVQPWIQTATITPRETDGA
jgi:hypothetical protein